MTTRSFINLSLASIFISLMSTVATAGMIVQTETKNSTNFVADTVFERFNPTLGTLTQVTLDVDLSVNVYDFDNNSGNCLIFMDCSGDVTLAVNGVQSLLPLSLSDAVPVTDEQVDVGVLVSLSITSLDIDFPVVTDFILSGPAPRLSTSIDLIGNSAPFGPWKPFEYSNHSGSITLTYQFDEVVSVSTIPEPATLALFGLGLVGLGFARARISQQLRAVAPAWRGDGHIGLDAYLSTRSIHAQFRNVMQSRSPL